MSRCQRNEMNQTISSERLDVLLKLIKNLPI